MIEIWAYQLQHEARSTPSDVLLESLASLRKVELELETSQAKSSNPLAELACWQQIENRARILKQELARREALARKLGAA